MANDSHHWTAGQILLEHYIVERELGAGGMGKVYLVQARSTSELFAVKTARFRKPENRRSFLAELRTWIDLPEHPHLAACRFFRTVGEDLVVFAEFVAGGSLASWIEECRLIRLDQLLDVAIQFAWGLHALHELGLVHRDVKPGNVLLTPDGTVKVADFGLSRARALSGHDAARPSMDLSGKDTAARASRRTLVTSAGGTPAYCSPEQAREERLSRKTDIWSWGISVLEMFVGEVNWLSGVVAAEALSDYLSRGPVDPRLPRMPYGVVAVLRKCFRQDPAQRWTSLAEAAEALRQIFRAVVGKDYPRSMPPIPRVSPLALPSLDDRGMSPGVQWRDPRDWLIKAFQADGRDPALVEAHLPGRAGSRKAQVIADLAAYEEAQRMLEQLVAGGRRDLEGQLARLCIEKAAIHERAGDFPGALAQYDRGIAIYEQLVEREGRTELVSDLALACQLKAALAGIVRDERAVLALCDRAIALYEWAIKKLGSGYLVSGLASACVNKAKLLFQENRPSALSLVDRAISLLEPLVEYEGRQILAADLSYAWMGKAGMLCEMGDYRVALKLCDRAIALYERLVEGEGQQHLTGTLASAYVGKVAKILDYLSDEMRKVPVTLTVGDVIDLGNAAVTLCNRAIALYEWLVEQQGRDDFVGDLAWSCVVKASVMSRIEVDESAAKLLCDRAIALYQWLVQRKGRLEFQVGIGCALTHRARTWLKLGERQKARSDAQEAERILRTEVDFHDQTGLQDMLKDAVKILNDAS